MENNNFPHLTVGIKNFKMPKNCWDCEMRCHSDISNQWYCAVTGNVLHSFIKDLNACPLVLLNKQEENFLESKKAKLRQQISSAGDRRDWDKCERLEKELEELENESK